MRTKCRCNFPTPKSFSTSFALKSKAYCKKNIAITRSFDTNYTKLEQIKERVSTFAVTVKTAEEIEREASNYLLRNKRKW